MNKLTVGLILVLLLAPTVVTAQDLRIGESCDLAIPGGQDKEGFLPFDRELRAALSEEDPVIMAPLVGFPLRVNGGGGTIQITGARSLQARFQDVFPPEVRSAVLDEPVESIFCNFGGIMYGSGQVWVEVTMQGRYQISTINLPRSQGAPGIFPKLDFVCDAEEHRVVIDLNEEGTPRYRAWNKPRSLTESPDLEVATGTKDYEGTGPCAHPIWRFQVGNAKFIVSRSGCSSESDPPPERSRGSLTVTVGDQEPLHWWCY